MAWQFTGLHKYNSNTGKEITYSIQEEAIILSNGDKYVPKINGTKITNTLTGTTHIEAQKIWIDNDNKNKTRPQNINLNIKKVLGGK